MYISVNNNMIFFFLSTPMWDGLSLKKHLTLLSLYAVEQRKQFIYCCDLSSAHILEEAKNMLNLTLSLHYFSTSQNPLHGMG
jgi:hypothetical protein